MAHRFEGKVTTLHGTNNLFSVVRPDPHFIVITGATAQQITLPTMNTRPQEQQ